MSTSHVTRLQLKTPSWDMAVVSVIALWLAYRFIPENIPSSDALGLPPELLPTASALGMAGLGALGFLLSLGRGAPVLEMAGTPWRPVFTIIGLCAASVVLISYTSLSIGALCLVPALMRLLRERRWTRILPTALIVAALIYFVVP